MKAPAVPVAEIVDDASDLLAELPLSWAGVLWASAVPLRLLQALFAARLLELGAEARSYGNHLHGLALFTTIALLFSLWGRAVFARACSRRLGSLTDLGLAGLVLPPSALAGYVYAALLLELLFFATAPVVLLVPPLVLVAGLAAATSPLLDDPGLLRPFRLIAQHARRVGPLVLLLLLFGVAFVLAAINAFVLAQAGLWLAGGLAGLNAARWQALLGSGNPRALLLAAAAGWLLVEPWWLAALVVHVHKTRSRSSGEDLRLWFERVREADA